MMGAEVFGTRNVVSVGIKGREGGAVFGPITVDALDTVGAALQALASSIRTRPLTFDRETGIAVIGVKVDGFEISVNVKDQL